MTRFLETRNTDFEDMIDISMVRHSTLARLADCEDEDFVAAGMYDVRKEEVCDWSTILNIKTTSDEALLDKTEELLKQEAVAAKAALEERGLYRFKRRGGR